MISSQIQGLLQPPEHTVSVQRAVALLNSKFTSLEQVKARGAGEYLEDSRLVSESLRSRLAASQRDTEYLIQSTQKRAKDQLVSAQELSLFRHTLSDELTGLSDELVSTTTAGPSEPSLLEEIETLHRNLKELESVKGYVKVVHLSLQLSERAVLRVEQLPTTTPISEASILDYTSLLKLVCSVGHACAKAEEGTGQGVKLAPFLKQVTDKTWLNIKNILSSSLLSASEKLHWPMPVDYAATKPDIRREFEHAFTNLLKLQEIGEIAHADRLSQGGLNQGGANSSNDELYCIQAIIRPVALRFKYHFEGTRQTNRLDKPEWYFAHILNVAHEHRPFLDIEVQRMLQTSKYSALIAWREFTRLLLPIISKKIRRSMPALLPHPPLLAHTIYQALAFDDALRETGFGLHGTLAESKGPIEEWEGTSDIILGSKEWFDTWLEGERRFAENQYNDTISTPDAWQIPDDADEDAAVNDCEVRPTNSARRVKSLIEQITDRYKPLPRFLHKTRFLITVQVPILELYHTRISESLDAFETLSSFLVRAVPGALAGQAGHGRETKQMTEGVEGSQRLVKAFVSAKWMASTLAFWGEDMFFLELWHQICEKASLRSRVESVHALPDPNVVNDEGTIFEELVSQYTNLADRAENMLIRQICGEVEADLKAHLYKQPHITSQSEDDLALSQTLLRPIARLSSHLSFLQKTLPANIMAGLYRKIAAHISSHILHRQILYRGRGRMSSREGRVILDECNLWVETSRMVLGKSMRKVEGPWQRLLETSRLLSLESEAFLSAVTAVRLGSQRDYEKLTEDLEIREMTNEDVIEVLSVREDYPK